MKRKYDDGCRDVDFVSSYIDALYEDFQRDEAARLAGEFLAGDPQRLLDNANAYGVFRLFERTPDSGAFRFVSAHYADFCARYGAKPVTEKLMWVWQQHLSTYFKHTADSIVVDHDGLARSLAAMRRCPLPDGERLERDTWLLAAEYEHRWNDYAHLCDDYQKHLPVADGTLYIWALRLDSYCKGKKERRMIRSWLTKRVASVSDGAMRESYEKLISKIK